MGVNKVVCGAVAIMDISDSAVTEDTLGEGAIAYGANGERITGKVTRYTNDDTHTFIGTEVKQGVNNRVGIWRITDKAEMMDAGTSYGLYAEGSNFGDAGPGDVRAGKTFTSKEGLKISGTWEPPVEKDVNFWDYDGTLLYSYTLEEIQALSELPKGPDWHDELVFFEWNWSLDSLKNAGYKVDVGAMYDTNDSTAHLHITLDEYVSKAVQIVITGDGNIDWGDGSEVESVSSTNSTMLTHEYEACGNYIIRIWSDSAVYLGYSSGTSNMFADANTYGKRNALLRKAFVGTKCRAQRYAFAYCALLEHTTLNPNVGFNYALFYDSSNLVCCHGPRRGNKNGYYIFSGCVSLRTVTLGDGATHINSGQFRNCRSLRRIRARKDIIMSETYGFYQAASIQEASGVLYSGNTSIFETCNSLREFDIHESSTAIAQKAFNSCFALQFLRIPASVTSIGAQAFMGCYTIRKIKFDSVTPPTVANANAFAYLATDCIIEVPAESLTAYQEVTNYGTIAAQMVGV